MCGVFGYVGEEKPDLGVFLLQGLAELEYRGYDSSGVSVAQNGKLRVYREIGELGNLREVLKSKKLKGAVGLGHTRWATHGGVKKKNSHPHLDCSKSVSVVHNGIIENHDMLRAGLVKKGHKFRSDTDTEVVAHLIEDIVSKGGSV